MECQECWWPKILPRYCFYCNQIEEFKNKSVSDILKGKKESHCICQEAPEYITIENKWRWNAPTVTIEQEEVIVSKIKGKKESDNKLSYELDWNFIEAMAKRMEQNKGKYPPYNRQKPMDIESLKQALLRHTIEVMKGNYTDIEDYDHLQALSLNAMFIYYQLKNNVTTPRSNTTHE